MTISGTVKLIRLLMLILVLVSNKILACVETKLQPGFTMIGVALIAFIEHDMGIY